MEPALIGPRHEAIDHGDLLVHQGRVTQLTRLGIPSQLAHAAADHVDWHQVATLVRRGCPVLRCLEGSHRRCFPGCPRGWRRAAALSDR